MPGNLAEVHHCGLPVLDMNVIWHADPFARDENRIQQTQSRCCALSVAVLSAKPDCLQSWLGDCLHDNLGIGCDRSERGEASLKRRWQMPRSCIERTSVS